MMLVSQIVVAVILVALLAFLVLIIVSLIDRSADQEERIDKLSEEINMLLHHIAVPKPIEEDDIYS